MEVETQKPTRRGARARMGRMTAWRSASSARGGLCCTLASAPATETPSQRPLLFPGWGAGGEGRYFFLLLTHPMCC